MFLSTFDKAGYSEDDSINEGTLTKREGNVVLSQSLHQEDDILVSEVSTTSETSGNLENLETSKLMSVFPETS